MGIGVFSDRGIRSLINDEIILSEEQISEEQIQPCSLDLRLGRKGYCMPYSSLPKGKNIEEFLRNNKLDEIDLEKNKLLHKGKIYVFPLKERLFLPDYLSAKANPKSSTGRIDVHVRLLTEGGTSFDNVSSGYRGSLWLEVYPLSFDLIAHENVSLNQLRIFDKFPRKLSAEQLECLHEEEGLLFNKRDGKKNWRKFKQEEIRSFLFNDTLWSSIDLERKITGYVAKSYAPPIDLRKRDLPASAYFDIIKRNKEGLIIPKDSFNILSSAELIKIPKGFCAEMVDIDTGSGEYRAHYAGFFDEGFHAQATLEFRNYGSTFLLKKGQKIAGLQFYPLRQPAEKTYGGLPGSNYQGQEGPTLSKFFDMKK